ncbi:hypothetical protein HK100_008035 [Physocladia obscura]|uniref:2-dehydropantoate 2-reductase n=1 Tax=Physocladia obscura TaxID=109957 RepID=A0AAD5T4Z5_9FUNG|nr:hypothetical protein HK100_008035 [Physocladia obscura]
MTNIAIFGAGLIGSYVAGMLASSNAGGGADDDSVKVTLLCRPSLANAVTANNNMLQVTQHYTGSGKLVSGSVATRNIPAASINILTDGLAGLKSRGIKPDFLIVTMKRISVDTAIKEMNDAGLNEQNKQKEGNNWFWTNTCIVMLQNGIDPSKIIFEKLGSRLNVIDGMFPFNVANSNGNLAHFEQGTSGVLYVTETASGRILADILTRSGIETATSSDMRGIQYGKLLLNLNNAVCALSATTLKNELAQAQYRKVFALCMNEALAVLDAAKIQPHSFTVVPMQIISLVMSSPDFLFNSVSGLVVKTNDAATSSMYEDLVAHRKTEIDFLQGHISVLGKQFGVPTPVCDRIVELVKIAEKSNILVAHSGDEILKLD